MGDLIVLVLVFWGVSIALLGAPALRWSIATTNSLFNTRDDQVDVEQLSLAQAFGILILTHTIIFLFGLIPNAVILNFIGNTVTNIPEKFYYVTFLGHVVLMQMFLWYFMLPAKVNQVFCITVLHWVYSFLVALMVFAGLTLVGFLFSLIRYGLFMLAK